MASQLCTCVFEGDLPLLRRLVSAGAPADAGDYDKRTALHIAASEGNTAAVRLPLPSAPAVYMKILAIFKSCLCF